MYRFFLKRVIDILFSLIGLVISSPVILIIAFLVKINLGSPVLFKQKRPGKDGKIFNLIKFRTMKEKYDLNGNPLPDKQRLTKFGKFLRSSSLDELPELFNILVGNMSFVGPRPLLPEYLEYYSDLENSRNLVRPGLTGLAQINGRNGLSWKMRFEFDFRYVQKVSIFLDMKIIVLTIIKTIMRKNINFSNTDTIYDYFKNRQGDSE